MKSEFSVAELVPHSGKMSLLDTIIDYDDDWLQAEVYITRDSMFADLSSDKTGVPGWVGLEYLAQTVGAFAGLQERLAGGKPKLGFLVGSRKYLCSAEYFSIGQTLSIKVHREMQVDNGLSVFQCDLQGDGVEASASLNVFQPDDAPQFLKEATS